METIQPKYLSTAEAAAYLGIKKERLEHLRGIAGAGPKVTQITAKKYLYSRENLDRFMEERATDGGVQ